jgi:hypothetical protein
MRKIARYNPANSLLQLPGLEEIRVLVPEVGCLVSEAEEPAGLDTGGIRIPAHIDSPVLEVELRLVVGPERALRGGPGRADDVAAPV